MSGSRGSWEERHRERDAAARPPSPFVVEHASRLRPGRALDIASGAGRHTLFLARLGWAVEAVDFAHAALARLHQVAIDEGLAIAAVQADLEHFPLPVERYDLVVNVRYLQRTLFAPIRAALKPGGVVLFETFLRGQEAFGHPRNPAFLLEPGELAAQFSTFRRLAYDEGRVDSEEGPALLARLCAQRQA